MLAHHRHVPAPADHRCVDPNLGESHCEGRRFESQLRRSHFVNVITCKSAAAAHKTQAKFTDTSVTERRWAGFETSQSITFIMC